MTEKQINSIIKLYNKEKLELEELIIFLLQAQNKPINNGIVNFLVKDLTSKKTPTEKLTIIYKDKNNTIVGFNETRTIAFTITSDLSENEYKNKGLFYENIELLKRGKQDTEQIYDIEQESKTKQIITSISNCKIGENEIYKFNDSSPLYNIIYNPTKYEYYLFDENGNIKRRCDINKKYKEIVDIYTDSNNARISNFYNIVKMDNSEIEKLSIEELKQKGGTWNIYFRCSLREKNNKREIRYSKNNRN